METCNPMKLIDIVHNPQYFEVLVFKAGELMNNLPERERFIKAVADQHLFLAACCKMAYAQPEPDITDYIIQKCIKLLEQETTYFSSCFEENALRALIKLKYLNASIPVKKFSNPENFYRNVITLQRYMDDKRDLFAFLELEQNPEYKNARAIVNYNPRLMSELIPVQPYFAAIIYLLCPTLYEEGTLDKIKAQAETYIKERENISPSLYVAALKTIYLLNKKTALAH